MNHQHNVGVAMSAILADAKFDWPDEPPLVLSGDSLATDARLTSPSSTEGLKPALAARFALKNGKPVYSRTENGWRLRLSLEPKLTDPKATVTYKLRDFWDDGDHETLSVGWHDGFEIPITSYGDLSIVTTLRTLD